MLVHYRVVDLRTRLIAPAELIIDTARSPEDAVKQALSMDVFRSGHKMDLVARVYFQTTGQPVTMVRLYRKPGFASSTDSTTKSELKR